MKIINATPKDKEELLSLYHAMIGGPCEWSENYPDENTIAFDLKNEDLFVMKNDKEEIVAMICTLFTGQPVRRVFLCVIVMSLK